MDSTTGYVTPAKKRSGPLINRNYGRLWAGQLVSNLGDFVFETTLVLWVAVRIAAGQPWAPLAVSGVLVAATLPIFLVGPLAGVFADRWNPRRTMMTMDAVRAVLVALLLLNADLVPLPFVAGGRLPLTGQLAAIYAVVFLAAACSQFFNPSRTVLIAAIVDTEHLPQASSLSQITLALATIVGPPLAAPLLFAFGVQWALLIDALSFVVSFLAIAAVRLDRPPAAAATQTGTAGSVAQGAATDSTAKATPSSVLGEFGQGLRFLLGSRVLVVLVVGLVISFLGAGSINALDVFFITRDLHAPAQLYGFAGTAYAAGVLLGALLGGAIAARVGLLRLVGLSLLWVGMWLFIFSRMTSFVPGLAVLVMTGIAQATINVSAGPILIRTAPGHLLGRVSALINPLVTAASLISIALAGYLASTVLVGLHMSIAGLALDPLNTIFGAAGVLVALGGIFVLLGYRGVTLPAEVALDNAANISASRSVSAAEAHGQAAATSGSRARAISSGP
jgi:MFS family permease